MSTAKIQTGLRLNEKTYEKLKVLSASEARSMNNLIEYIIQKYIEEHEKAHGPIRISAED